MSEMSASQRTATAECPPALRLPDFLIIGAAKSATTTLFAHLRHHSQICPCREKEPMFFASEQMYKRGLTWYGSLFEGAGPDQRCFEASTGYTRWPQVPDAAERIARHLPRARLIYIMRHPVDRAYSHYVHRYTKELHPGQPIRQTFEEFIEEHPVCLDSSLYLCQIERYLAHFSRDAMLLLLTDDFESDRAGTLRRVERFLEVRDETDRMMAMARERENQSSRHGHWTMRRRVTEPLRRIPLINALASRLPQRWRDWGYEVLRRSPYGAQRTAGFRPRPMLPETRARLLASFEKPNQELAKFLNRDLSMWSC